MNTFTNTPITPNQEAQPQPHQQGQLVMICPYATRIMQMHDGSNILLYPLGQEKMVIEWLKTLVQYMRVNDYQSKGEHCTECTAGQVNGKVCPACKGSTIKQPFAKVSNTRIAERDTEPPPPEFATTVSTSVVED